MFRNYLKIALRNLLRQKFFTLVNIIGFSTGITCWLLIMLWSDYEKTAQKEAYKNQDIYRVGRDAKETTYWHLDSTGEGIRTLYPETPVPLANVLRKNFKEVTKTTRFGYLNDAPVRINSKRFISVKFAFADSNIFDFFRFRFIEGSEKEALSKPYSIIITKDIADNYFSDENPIDKVIYLGNSRYYVSAVIKNIPLYYKMQFDFLVPYASLNVKELDNYWAKDLVNTYIILKPNTDPDNLSFRLAAYIKVNKLLSYDDPYVIRPLPVLNVYGSMRKSTTSSSESLYIYIFSAAALLILLIACLNYSNLTIASFKNRTKEIGVRKVYGAMRSDIIIQFLSESVILSLISLIVSITLIYAVLPGFNSFTGKHILLGWDRLLDLFPQLSLIAIIVGLISGIYPALYISSLSPVKILSGSLRSGAGSDMFRKLFLYIQCTISISMIIASFFVNYQLDHLRNKREGYDESSWLSIPSYGKVKANYKDIKKELFQNANILSVLNKDEAAKEGSLFSGLDAGTKDISDGEFMYINIKSKNIPNTVKYIENIWNRFEPDYPFDYNFIDKALGKEFETETRMAGLFSYLTMIMVVLTSLGLFAMSAYICAQRRREIAIRKTLGAGTFSLYYMILKEFLIVLLVSNVTAYFTSLVMSTNWVYNFSSRINITPGPFLYATLVSFVLLIISVSRNAFKAALTNPADILRYE